MSFAQFLFVERSLQLLPRGVTDEIGHRGGLQPSAHSEELPTPASEIAFLQQATFGLADADVLSGFQIIPSPTPSEGSPGLSLLIEVIPDILRVCSQGLARSHAQGMMVCGVVRVHQPLKDVHIPSGVPRREVAMHSLL